MDKKNIEQKSCELNDDVVVVGSEGKNIPVSFQVLQDIYNELTGKTEEIENNYKVSYKIKFEDIEQLHIKIQQAFEQYNIKSSNCTVTVFFVKGSKEVFSSFDRFKLFNSSTLSETERVYIKFNFMIILPKTKRIQQYEINVNLSSGIGASKKVNEDMGASSKLFKFFIGYTAQVNIKYIDYLVARNFLDIIDEWVKCLPSNKKNKAYKFMTKNSHLFPIIFKNMLFVLAVILIWLKFPFFIPKGTSDLYLFSQFLIPAIPFAYFSLRLGWTIGKFTENAIDEYQLISYISITRGDEKLIEEVKEKNKKRIAKVVLGIVTTFRLYPELSKRTITQFQV